MFTDMDDYVPPDGKEEKGNDTPAKPKKAQPKQPKPQPKPPKAPSPPPVDEEEEESKEPAVTPVKSQNPPPPPPDPPKDNRGGNRGKVIKTVKRSVTLPTDLDDLILEEQKVTGESYSKILVSKTKGKEAKETV